MRRTWGVCCVATLLATLCGLLASGLVSLANFSPAIVVAGETNAAGIGKKLNAFSLADHQGKQHQLAELRDQKLVVVAFLGAECPLARLYGPRLVELRREFAQQGVGWVGVFSNTQDSAADVAAFVKECELDFPALLDSKNELADALGAQRTPEVFLLDADRVVRYRGRIDDQYGVGLKRDKVGKRDLADAVSELLAGKAVSQATTDTTGCLIGRAKKPTESNITYTKHIVPILQDRCVVCHREGEIAPFSVTSYDEVVGWAETILEVVDAGRMPPWFASPEHGSFANDARMSDQEKATLRTWVKNGCPQGDPKDMPPAREFAEGWNIGKPDVIVKASEKPVPVAATGVVAYQYLQADPGFTEDKWMTATEVRPSNRAVVHHVLVYAIPKGASAEQTILAGTLIGAYAPGSPPRASRPGMAMRIPAGSKILFQMHYTPNGKETEDTTLMGLRLCDEKEVQQKLVSGWAINFGFAIPPQADDFPVKSQYKFTEDRMLLGLTPHMHLRGKTFRYEARYPDGSSEILLDVPKWDFNWQIDYALAKPRLMPKGTVLACMATFDNSPGNPANPDPTKKVTFGEQTWDEMMIGWFVTASVKKPEQAAAK